MNWRLYFRASDVVADEQGFHRRVAPVSAVAALRGAQWCKMCCGAQGFTRSCRWRSWWFSAGACGTTDTRESVGDACGSNDECDGADLCVDGSCAADCEADGDCELGFLCQGTMCTSGCRTNSDCPTAQSCEDIGADGTGQCRAPQLITCDTDRDCRSGEICSVGRCASVGCVSDSDCPPRAQRCVERICEPLCQSNADCESPEMCQNIDSETGEGNCAVYEPQCRSDRDCAFDEVCEDETCIWRRIEWPYVAVISSTTNSEDLFETSTPGPDLDTVSVTINGLTHYADTIHVFAQGNGGEDGVFNDQTDVSMAVGPPDAIPVGGGDCDLSSGFWSMGNEDGFVVVGFDVPLSDGAVITVWELDDVICDNVGVTRSDRYDVLIGNNEVQPGDIGSARSLSGDNWIYLGSSSFSGGYGEFTADLP